jgi:hypothetical protein
MLRDALELFNACHQVAQWSGAPYLIENPIGALSTHVRDPDFIFDPFEFGGYLDAARRRLHQAHVPVDGQRVPDARQAPRRADGGVADASHGAGA